MTSSWIIVLITLSHFCFTRSIHTSFEGCRGARGEFVTRVNLDDVYNMIKTRGGKSPKESGAIHEKPSKAGKKRRKQLKGEIPPRLERNVILPSSKKNRRSIVAQTIKGFDILLGGILKSKDVLKSSADIALKSTQNIKRGFKSYFSSDFEALILRLTNPNDSRPPNEDVERIIATVSTFVRNVDLTSESNPYRVTLRKLWTKMAEPDARTILKALLILHNLLRSSDPEDSVIFKTLMAKMSKEFCKKTDSLYFDPEKMFAVFKEEDIHVSSIQQKTSLGKKSARLINRKSSTRKKDAFGKRLTKKKAGEDTKNLVGLVGRYAAYVLRRARTFTSSFEEMKLIAHGMRTEDICAQMVKACKLLDTAIACKLSAVEECEVSTACIELVARDIRTLFLLFHEKLR